MPKFSKELENALNGKLDETEFVDLEASLARSFSDPDLGQTWREGTNKSSFNYLLLDPRVTKDLPRRVKSLGQWHCARHEKCDASFVL